MENLIQDLLNASFSRLIGQFNNNQGNTEFLLLMERFKKSLRFFSPSRFNKHKKSLELT